MTTTDEPGMERPEDRSPGMSGWTAVLDAGFRDDLVRAHLGHDGLPIASLVISVDGTALLITWPDGETSRTAALPTEISG